VDGETIIAAALAFVGGGGASRLAKTLGPTRRQDVVQYYRDVAKGLEDENARLWKRIRTQGKQLDRLERKVARIEAGELPPEYS
jgi:hypothetical protein